MKRAFYQLGFVALLFSISMGASCLSAQESSSKRPAESDSPAKDTPASDTRLDVSESAAKDIDVGNFYLHKGDIDAAIDRFQDAIQAQPNLGKPRLLIAQAYEKKHDSVSALKYYKEYLQVFPHPPDAKKIQARIEKLSTPSR